MDKSPAIPFTLLLPSPHRRDEVNLETVVNTTTNEQFSVSQCEKMIEVNRTRASEKKEKISLQNQEVYYRYLKVLCSFSEPGPSSILCSIL